MSEEEAIKELKAMSEPELALVPFDTVKFVCTVKGCKRHTKARDYGIGPVYYHSKMTGKWHNVQTGFFTCAIHWKFYQKLLKNYSETHVFNKLIDMKKERVLKL